MLEQSSLLRKFRNYKSIKFHRYYKLQDAHLPDLIWREAWRSWRRRRCRRESAPRRTSPGRTWRLRHGSFFQEVLCSKKDLLCPERSRRCIRRSSTRTRPFRRTPRRGRSVQRRRCWTRCRCPGSWSSSISADPQRHPWSPVLGTCFMILSRLSKIRLNIVNRSVYNVLSFPWIYFYLSKPLSNSVGSQSLFDLFVAAARSLFGKVNIIQGLYTIKLFLQNLQTKFTDP